MTQIKSYIICGRNGSGKGTLSEYLAKELNAPVFRLSDIPRRFLEEFDIPETRENFSKMSSLIRELFGEDAFVRAVDKFLDRFEGNTIIFDGPRKVNLIRKIQERTEAKIIFVDTSPEKRYERILKRSEKDNESCLSYEQFLEQENLQTEREMDEIIALANILLENNGTREEFFRKIDSLL